MIDRQVATEAGELSDLLRMPTPEEHRKVSLAWLSRVQPCLIDQWPADLAALSIPTKFVKIDVDPVWDAMCDLQDGKKAGIPQPLVDLAAEMDDVMGWDRKFVRLNSRSPKDWPWPFEVPATISGKEAVSMLAGSRRVMDDLYEFKWVPEQPAYVCLRDWVCWIRSQYEFRCFVKDGELIAVTHYDYTKPTPEAVRNNAGDIRAAIDTYFAERLKPALHIDTVVFDIAFDQHKMSLDPMLIEINPYGLSDPCWFGDYEAVENADCDIKIGTGEED